MAAASKILGPDGQPAQRRDQGRRMAGLNGTGAVPWDAADSQSAEMDGWHPYLGSADSDTNYYRDRIVARIRDVVRNDGWAAGGITKITDAVIGADLRLSSVPDYRALASAWGKGFDATWAKEFSATAEALWRSWANDPGLWCEAGRRVTMAGVFRLAFRTLLVEGDALALLLWRPGRMAPGRARYATTVQLIDPDRLSNPQQRMDTAELRGGVEVDDDGAAIAYHIRRAHLGDWWAAGRAVQWDRIERETAWGRPIVVHCFESDRIGQHRGAGGVLKPVLSRAKMLARYEQVELQAAVLNAVFAAYIESPFDRDLVGDSLAPEGELSAYQQMREGYHSAANIRLNNARIPILAPGEKIASVTAARPASNYPAFQAAALRHLAGALGTSYEQLSADYSQSNYSSARAALIETWKTLSRRRHEFAQAFAAPIYGAFLEEAMDRGELPLPASAPDFMQARAEYARCRWIGPGRGWVDPVKEPQGALMKIAGALSTLQHEAGESGGMDIEEILDQRALEIRMFQERGLPVPPVLLGNPPPTVTAGANALEPPAEDAP